MAKARDRSKHRCIMGKQTGALNVGDFPVGQLFVDFSHAFSENLSKY